MGKTYTLTTKNKAECIFYRICLLSILLVVLFSSISFTQIINVELTGTFSPEDRLSYKTIPFEVPENIGIILFQFEYETHLNEVEIGVFDPHRFRGTSRFSKSSFHIAENFATPSYVYGPIVSGTWNISLGFPVINRDGTYIVHITMISKADPMFSGPSRVNINDKEGWYSGDFHTHTGHSDGFGCRDTYGSRTPCQVFQIAQSAHLAGLDFVAVADHNTISHFQDVLTLQANYPDLLILKSQELTTFYGHAVIHGSREWVDFRLGPNGYGIKDILTTSKKRGSLFSIVHPGRETGDSCTGCGWSIHEMDYTMVDAIEIVNGANVETKISGIPFWHEKLNKGYKITGIGGSDDHSAGFGNVKIGTPTTVVWSKGLSEFDVLNAVKSGRVYIRTNRDDSVLFDFFATSESLKWDMGSQIPIEVAGSIHFTVRMDDMIHTVEVIIDGVSNVDLCQVEEISSGYECVFTIPEPNFKWIRINIRDQNGNIRIISNPIYKGDS